MIRIYTRNGHHDLPDTLLSILGQIVAQSNSPVDVLKNATYTDIHETLLPEIDETEAVPVLEDIPEDPEITIERLNAKILELEAELEERRRSTDAILEALRPLGTIVVDQAGVSAPEPATVPLVAESQWLTSAKKVQDEYNQQAKQQAGYHSYNLSAKF